MVDIDQILKNDVVRSEKIQALKTKELRQCVFECQEDIRELEQCQQVLQAELNNENQTTEQLFSMVTLLKKNIH